MPANDRQRLEMWREWASSLTGLSPSAQDGTLRNAVKTALDNTKRHNSELAARIVRLRKCLEEEG